MAMILFLLLGLSAAHPNSLSSSRVVVSGQRTVAGQRIEVTLRCQVLSFLEVLPQLDANSDGDVVAGEVAALRAELFAYASAHYALTIDTDEDGAGGVLLVAQLDEVSHVATDTGDGLAMRGGAIDLQFHCETSQEIDSLLIDVDLFRETSPDHVDLTSVLWPNGVTRSFGLNAENPSARSLPTDPGTFETFLELGFDHILAGWDHIAFLVALLLSSRSLRSVLGWVTAFTLAHSITLALATLRVVDVGGWEPLIESAIALSIAYVAADNLWRPDLKRGRWLEAFGFGLLHGLGFAGFLGASLVFEQSQATALFSFNLGVELGQLAIVTILVAPFWWLARKREAAQEFLLPLALRRGGSAVVVVLGLYWFFQRL